MTVLKKNGINRRIIKDYEDTLRDVNCNSKKVDFAVPNHATALSLPREEVPSVMWEPGILTGYRPINQPWIYYIKSLFWIHNETMNIWTHLLSPLFTLSLVYLLSQNLGISTTNSFQGICMGVAAANGLFMVSTSAHLFRNKSELVQNIVMCLDYSGVGLFLYGQFIMLYYCSGNELFYKTVGTGFPTLIGVCALNVVICHVVARNLYKTGSKGRKLLQVSSVALCAFIGHIPLYFRLFDCYMSNSCFTENMNIYHIYSSVICTPSATFFFALHIPEKLCPGKFDIFGHGHQWFHVIITLGVIAAVYAAYIDLLTIPKGVLELADPNFTHIWGNLFTFIFLDACVFIMAFFTFKKSATKK